MNPLILLFGLLLGGCSSLPPVTQACLDDPPTDPFMVSMCKTLVSLPERDRADRQRWEAAGQVKAPVSAERACDAACQEYRLMLLESGMPTPFDARQRSDDWMFYHTPHGTYTNLGDGVMMDPQGRMYYPY